MKYLSLIWVTATLMSASACQVESYSTTSNAALSEDLSQVAGTYIISEIGLRTPDESTAGFDLDGDGELDNKVASLINSLPVLNERTLISAFEEMVASDENKQGEPTEFVALRLYEDASFEVLGLNLANPILRFEESQLLAEYNVVSAVTNVIAQGVFGMSGDTETSVFAQITELKQAIPNLDPEEEKLPLSMHNFTMSFDTDARYGMLGCALDKQEVKAIARNRAGRIASIAISAFTPDMADNTRFSFGSVFNVVPAVMPEGF